MIREAIPDDEAAIRSVVAAAFDRPDEAALVDRLRSDGDVLVELVAHTGRVVVGHVVFSRLRLHGETLIEAAALAPVSVRPDRQRSGIGSKLVVAGLAACSDLAIPVVVVLGHPGYYPRFGFSAAAAERLQAPFGGPSFMAVARDPAALDAAQVVEYAPAFGLEGWFRNRRRGFEP